MAATLQSRNAIKNNANRAALVREENHVNVRRRAEVVPTVGCQRAKAKRSFRLRRTPRTPGPQCRRGRAP